MLVDVVTHVKARHFLPGVAAEDATVVYALDNAGDVASWRANAAAWPAQVLESTTKALPKIEADVYSERIQDAATQARAMKLSLRTAK